MSILIAMLLFSLVMSFSPGPVNMVILSSGINHGVRSTLPYVSGATIGFTLLLVASGMLIQQLIAYPIFFKTIGIIGSLYIIYLGYKIAGSTSELNIRKGTPPKFYEGFILQWLNAKAWIACASGVALFSNIDNPNQLKIFYLVYFIVCYFCLAFWAIMGGGLARWLNSQLRLRIFNYITGGLLVLTALYLLFTQVFE